MVATQPNFSIIFKELAVQAIQRLKRGEVILILDDTTNGTLDKKTYTSFGEVNSSDFTTANYKSIWLAFLGKPKSVTIIKKETTFAAIQAKLDHYANYILAYPAAVSADMTSMASYALAQRQKNNYIMVVVGAMTTPDAEYVINFTTAGIKANLTGTTEDFTTGQYTARVAGAFAGLPATQSLTYYEFGEVVTCTLSATPDADCAAGKLIIIQQNGAYKLGRAVNSLTTLTGGKTELFQKLRNILTMDIVAGDIISTFQLFYVGKVPNTYANLKRFVGSANAYLKSLEVDELLEVGKNQIVISYAKKKAYIESKGVSTANMSYTDIMTYNTGSKVLLDGTIAPIDTMEDLDLNVYLNQIFEEVA